MFADGSYRMAGRILGKLTHDYLALNFPLNGSPGRVASFKTICQPFTAPSVRPPIILRSKISTSTIIGKTEIIAAAIILPHGVWP